MAWLRYSDTFTQQREWDSVSYEARWHYKALVERCSVGRRWSGCLTIEQARRASDVPDPDACIAELEKAGLLTVTRNNPRNGAPVDNPAADPSVTRNSDVTSSVTCDAVTVTVTRIEEHIPPPSVRDNAEKSALRMRRKRAHDKGEHHLCLPKHCPDAPPENAPSVTRGVTRNPGTGLDRSVSPRVERSEDTTSSSDDEISQSGQVGGAGGGSADRVARNTSRVRPAAGDIGRKVSRAAQEREAARWLHSQSRGLTDGIIARVFAVAYTRAADAGEPVRHLPTYLKSWAPGDVADVVAAAMDLEDLENSIAQDGAEEEPSGLRLVSSRDRRAAIDACRRCDHNGLTHEDKPRRCDHRAPGQGSQLPLMQSVDEEPGEAGDTAGLPAADDRRTARAVMERVNEARAARRHG